MPPIHTHAAALALLLCAAPAVAEPYLVVGVGQARFSPVDVDGHWQQARYESRTEDTDATWRLGVGLQLTDWLSVEGDYRNFGSFNRMLRFVSDAQYAAGCTDCEVRTAWLHGKTHGLAASAVIAPDWQVAPMLRAGVLWHWSQFTAHYADGDAIHSYSREGKSASAPPFNDSGPGWLLGAGVRAGRFDAEFTWYPAVASGGSAYHDIYSATLSVRF
jgi:hypothetical protein